MTLKVTSSGFRHGDNIPETFALGVPAAEGHASMGGGNRNPDLRWSGEPAGTKSFVVLLVDGDVPADMAAINKEGQTIPTTAPRRDFAHWLVVDLLPSVREIAEGAASDGFIAQGKPVGQTRYGGITGANGYTQFLAGDQQLAGTYGGYDGPFPPFNDERAHNYRFQVYALDVPSLGLAGAFGLDDVRRAMRGHVLDQGELIGVYALNPGAAAVNPDPLPNLATPPA